MAELQDWLNCRAVGDAPLAVEICLDETRDWTESRETGQMAASAVKGLISQALGQSNVQIRNVGKWPTKAATLSVSTRTLIGACEHGKPERIR